MKCIIVLCLTFVAVIYAKDDAETTTTSAEDSSEESPKSKSFLEQCLDENKLKVEDVRPINMGDFSNATKDIQCFAKCLIGKYGFVVDGVIKEDVIFRLLSPLVGEEKLKIIVENCKRLKGEDNCETTFKLYECFYTLHAEAKEELDQKTQSDEKESVQSAKTEKPKQSDEKESVQPAKTEKPERQKDQPDQTDTKELLNQKDQTNQKLYRKASS